MANLKNIARDAFGLFKGKLLEKPRMGEQSQFNLNTFMGQLQEVNSMAQASKYTLEIKPPKWAAGSGAAERLIFFCDSVNIGGGTAVPAEIKSQGFGPFDRRPSQFITPDITTQIMLDSNGNNLGFFQEWMNNIINIDASGGEQTEKNGAAFGEVYYRDNYLTELTITMYDVAGNPTVTYRAYEAWPTTLGDVQLGWNSTDEIARLQVNFSIRYWTTDVTDSPTEAAGPRALSGFEQLIRIGTAGKALKASMKKPTSVGDVINVVSNAQTFLGSFGGRRTGG
jgi:hypothetical protein